MATPSEPLATQEQVSKATWLYNLAIAYVGIVAAQAALTGAPSAAVSSAASGGYYLTQAVARAFYMLMRAAYLGSTVAILPGRKAGDSTTMKELYEDFEAKAMLAIPESKREAVRSILTSSSFDSAKARSEFIPDPEDDATSLEKASSDLSDGVDLEAQWTLDEIEEMTNDPSAGSIDSWDDRVKILVEAIDGALAHDEELQKQLDEELRLLAERQAADDKAYREALTKEEARAKREADLDPATREAARKRRLVRESKLERARRRSTAGEALKAALHGARAEIQSLSSKDKGAMGFARVPHSSTPCGWCLMLASRGWMLYTSRATASAAWHENCMCSVEPVFTADQFFKSQEFLKNRTLYRLWEKHGDTYEGKLSNWRSVLREEFKTKSLDGLVQEGVRKYT